MEDALNAYKHGAEQIELCSRLDLDGLTPVHESVRKLSQSLPIPIKVMLRPHDNGFVYSEDDMNNIRKDIEIFKQWGIKQFVFGALAGDVLDIDCILQVCQWISPHTMTIHKAIDLSRDPISDIRLLKSIDNVSHILSSGAAQTAHQGINTLIRMKQVAGEEIDIIPAGKITYKNINELHQILACKIYHGREIVQMTR